MGQHPWASDPEEQAAVRAAEDAAAAERTPLPDHRELPQAIAELRERVARLEAAVIPKYVSVSNAEVHENKGCTMPADGLRTERVTLEITQRAESYTLLRDFDWQRILRQAPGGLWPGESVRVVEEAAEITRLTAERDASKKECERLGDRVVSAELACRRAEARVAELEQQIKLDDRWAATAPAANAGCVSNPGDVSGTGKSNRQGKLDGSQEPVAWGVRWNTDKVIDNATFDSTFPTRKAAGEYIDEYGEEDDLPEIVPLYAAPQPPRGWLTEEERTAVKSARLHLSNSDCLDEATERECKWASDVFRRLLARSTPPRVKVPKAGSCYDKDAAWIAAIREAGGEVE